MADSTGLGDILAGAAGAPVNRPALNAYITAGQAQAGLRSAQTEEALVNAQRGRDEADAASQLEAALGGIMKPADAKVAATVMRAHFGNSQQALDALKTNQENQNRATLSDPAQLGTPAQTAAAQGVQGKLEPFTQVPSAYALNPGQPAPDVRVSPVASSKMSLEEAQGFLAHMRATNPGAFQANNFTPEQVQALHDYIVENPNAAPTGRALMTRGGAAVASSLTNGPVPATTGADGQPKPAAVPGATPAQTANPDAAAAIHVEGSPIKPAPGVSLAEQASIRKDYASSKGAGGRMSAINTMALHSFLWDKVADQLHNGNFTPTNEISLLWKRMFGETAPVDLRLVGDFLGKEAVRATINSGAGTGEERELKIPQNASADQMHSGAKTLRALVGGQGHSLIRAGARGGVDATQFLDPEVINAFGLGHGAGGPVPGGAGPTMSQTPIGSPEDPLGLLGK